MVRSQLGTLPLPGQNQRVSQSLRCLGPKSPATAIMILTALACLWVQPGFGLEPVEIYDRWAGAVVTVLGSQGQGSGFLIPPAGQVVTNRHVVAGQGRLQVILHTGERRWVLSVLHEDPDRDLAILSIDPTGMPHVVLGDSSRVRPGDRVVAIGAPQGLQQTVTEGIISQVRRVGGITLLQTQTPISPGSSGGPLFNARGEVIGINVGTWREEGQNLNFAIAVNELRAMLSQAIPTPPRISSRMPPEQPRATPPLASPSEQRAEEIHRQPTPPGSIERRGKDKAEMVYIPAGTFTMGDTYGDGDSDEKPAHQVTLAAFWLDKTGVTNAQFAQFVRASSYHPEKDQHPVVSLTWHEAANYCRWTDKRLPTEAEREYAARGIDGRRYPWGNTWEETRARFAGNRGNQTTAPVGSYPTGASPFGVLDLAGNVWEWTGSLYKPYPYEATDGREDVTASLSRVVRGGSWNNPLEYLRSSDRSWYGAWERINDLGFRCAQSP